MITQNYKKWLFLLFILLVILYACTSEQDYQLNADKPVEPLTVATAKSLYEQYVGKTSQLKSASYDSAIELTPDWSRSELFSDSNWYVVESALKLEQGKVLRFMTNEVKEYSETNDVHPQQVLRQVVMRNKQTGQDYAFIMVIMPDLNYMLQKGNELGQNTYLTRIRDLSGTVIFYTTAGALINGWVYQNGSPVTVFGIPEEALGKRRKDWVVYNKCWWQEGGSHNDSYLIRYCETHYKYEYDNFDLELGSVNLEGDNDPSLPSPGPGSTPPPLTPEDKKPEEPTDPCKSMSSKMAATNFTQTITALKGLTGQKYEAGRAYTYDNGKYNFTTQDGNPGEPEITYSPKGFSKIDGFIHSHYDGLLKTFSSSDLMIPYHWFMNKNGINNLNTFSLGLVTSEGTYFLFVSDLAKYMDFGKMFADRKGLDILSHFYKEGYKIDETKSALASMESLIKLLDNLNSGLTLMKDSGNNKFSIVTKDSNGNIKLVNCN